MKLLLVTGDRDAGKTAWLRRAAGETGASGILCIKHFGSEGFYGYDGVFLDAGSEGDPVPMIRPAVGLATVRVPTVRLATVPEGETAGWFSWRRFVFNPAIFEEVLSRAERWSAPVIIDEAGPLEMEGGGFAAVLIFLARRLARRPAGERGPGRFDLAVAVRPSLVDEIPARFFPGADTEVLWLPDSGG
jgi:hypothetical protein